MVQVWVKKSFGRKYLITLSGHEHAFGEIECVVNVPNSLNKCSSAAQRRVAIARALDLSAAFHTSLRSKVLELAASSTSLDLYDDKPLFDESSAEFIELAKRGRAISRA